MKAIVPTKVPMVYVGADKAQIVSRAKKTEEMFAGIEDIDATFMYKAAMEYKKDPQGYKQMLEEIGNNPLLATKHIPKLKAIFGANE